GTGHQPTGELLVAITVAAATYLVLNHAMLSVPVAIVSGASYRSTLKSIGSASGAGALPFAVLGLGFGLVYLNWGSGAVIVAIVPILIARQAFKSYLMLAAAQEQTIETLIRALEAKDPYTAGHAQRVAKFSEYIGEELTLGPRRMERLRYAALMHDIGKLIVP